MSNYLDFEINWDDWVECRVIELPDGGYVGVIDEGNLPNGISWDVQFNPDETGGALIEELIPEVIAEWESMRSGEET